MPALRAPGARAPACAHPCGSFELGLLRTRPAAHAIGGQGPRQSARRRARRVCAMPARRCFNRVGLPRARWCAGCCWFADREKSVGVSANNIRNASRHIRAYTCRVPVLVLRPHTHHSYIFQKSDKSLDNSMMNQSLRPLPLRASTLIVIAIKTTLAQTDTTPPTLALVRPSQPRRSLKPIATTKRDNIRRIG